MKKIYMKFILRNRNIIIVLGIMLSVIMIFSLLQIGTSMLMQYRKLATGGFNYDISVSKLENDKAELVSRYATEKGFDPIIEENVCSVSYGSFKDGMLLSYNNNDLNKGAFHLLNGDYPNKKDEIVISESFSTAYGLKCRDNIDLKMLSEDGTEHNHSFNIAGIFKDNSALNSEEYLLIYANEETSESVKAEMTAQIDAPYGVYLTKDKDSFDSSSINIAANELRNKLYNNYSHIKAMNEDKLSSEEKELISDAELNISVNEAKKEAFSDKNMNIKTFLLILLLALIIAFSMVLLIFNLINLAEATRIHDISMLRCLGMNHKQIYQFLILEIMVYFVIGCGAGLLIGNLFNKIVGEKILQSILLDDSKLVQSPAAYIITVVISLVSVLASNLKIIGRVFRISPASGIKLISDENTISSVGKPVNNKKLYSSFALRNIRRNRGKSLTIICSLTVFSMLFCVILHSVMSITFSNELSSSKMKYADIEAVFDEEAPTDASVDGVKTIYRYGTAPLLSNAEDSSLGKYAVWSGMVLVFDDTLFKKFLNDTDLSEKLSYDEAQIIYCSFGKYSIDEKKLGDRIIKIEKNCKLDGDTAELKFADSDSPVTIKMNAILDEYNFRFESRDDFDSYFIINRAFADEYGLEVKYNYLLFDVDGDVTPEIVANIKKNVLNENGKLYNFVSEKNESRRQLKGMIFLALYLVVSTASTGFINMGNTIKFNILMRRKENALLRAIGMTRVKLRRIICLENLFMMSAALLIGLCIATVINCIITSAIIKSSQFHIIPYIITFLITLVTGTLVAVFTAIRCEKKKIAEEIRETE